MFLGVAGHLERPHHPRDVGDGGIGHEDVKVIHVPNRQRVVPRPCEEHAVARCRRRRPQVRDGRRRVGVRHQKAELTRDHLPIGRRWFLSREQRDLARHHLLGHHVVAEGGHRRHPLALAIDRHHRHKGVPERRKPIQMGRRHVTRHAGEGRQPRHVGHGLGGDVNLKPAHVPDAQRPVRAPVQVQLVARGRRDHRQLRHGPGRTGHVHQHAHLPREGLALVPARMNPKAPLAGEHLLDGRVRLDAKKHRVLAREGLLPKVGHLCRHPCGQGQPNKQARPGNAP